MIYGICEEALYCMKIPFRQNPMLIIHDMSDSDIKSKLTWLKTFPNHPQRTADWYAQRHNLFSASNLWKLFGTQSQYNSLIYEKCNDVKKVEFEGDVLTPNARNWGVKYEPVSVMVYEHMYDFVYYLGNVPAIIFPYSWNHYRATCVMGSHAVIYSESYRNALLRVPQEKIKDWDVFQLTFKPHLRFMYYKPLCYQLFPITENSEGWGNENIFLRGLAIFVFQLFQLLKLNKQTSPGYPFFYFTSKVIFWVLLLIVIFVFFPYKKLNVFRVFNEIYNPKHATRKSKHR